MIYSYSKIKTDQNYNEDFKTYSTLGVLQFLPAQLFWNILKASVIGNQNMPSITGEMVQIDFWPKWYNVQNIKVVLNSTYIEPDVFIRFENFDCVIEVKKTDSFGQHYDQWESQIQAYRNEYPEGKKLIYIALGGNQILDAPSQEKFRHVYKSTWQRLIREIDKALQERVSVIYKTETINLEIRILQSAMDAFACYNEYVVELLDTMNIHCQEIKQPTKESLKQLWKI